MLKRQAGRYSRVYAAAMTLLSCMLLIPLFLTSTAKAASYSADESSDHQAILGMIVELQDNRFRVEEIPITAETDGQKGTASVQSGRVVTIEVTESTVYDRLAGFADLDEGDTVAVAGVRQGTNQTLTIVADYIVPLTELSLSEAITEAVDQVQELDENEVEALLAYEAAERSALHKPDARVSIASSQLDKRSVPVDFRYNQMLHRGSWGFGKKRLVDLGELGAIEVGILLGRSAHISYHYPAQLEYQMPKLVVGETAEINFHLPMTHEAFPGYYTVTFTFTAKVDFSLTALGKTYHLLDHQVVERLRLDTKETAEVFRSATKRIPAISRTFSFAVPRTDLAFKFSIETDTLFRLNKPDISEMLTASGAVITDNEGATNKKRREFAPSKWKITPTATTGTINVPVIRFGPSINQVTIKLRTELTGPIPIPINLFAAHTFSVDGTEGISQKIGITFTAAPAIEIAESLPGGLLGRSYTAQIHTSGGYAPYRYELVSGVLPAGLYLDSATGTIQGIPYETNTDQSFTIRMTDGAGYSKTQTYTIPILHLPSDGVVIGQTIHQPFAFDLEVLGGVPPYSWQLVEGSLPPSLVLNTDVGRISGTPTEAGTYSFRIQVTDQTGQTTGHQQNDITSTAQLTMVIVPVRPNGHYIWEPGVHFDLDDGPGNAMVYHPETGETMMFTSRGETVVLRDGSWQKLEIDGPAPLPRDNAVMAYSPNLGGIVLFGGETNDHTPKRPAPYTSRLFSDTWLWDGESWTELHKGVYWIREYKDGKETSWLSGDDGPPERYSPAMSQDPNGNIVLYGGHPGYEPYYGDTWVLKLENGEAKWSEVDTVYQPPLSVDPVMVYHEALQRSVLILSDDVDFGPNEVWLWTGSDWQDLTAQVFQNGGPTWHYAPSVAYDRVSKQLLLYGGRDTDHWGEIRNELWALGTFASAEGTASIGNWRQLESFGQPVMSKTNNQVHGIKMAYDASTGQMVIFSKDFDAATNVFLYTLSGLQASPPAVPADGIAKTTLSYTVVNPANEPIAGKEMLLQGIGAQSGKLPVLSAVSDSLGNVTFEVSHTVAEQVAYTITEAGSDMPLGAGTVQYTKPVPNAAQSSLVVSKSKLLLDGADEAIVTVTIRNENGRVLPGYQVHVRTPGSSTAVIEPQVEGVDVSQADGKAAFRVRPAADGQLNVEAAVVLDDASELVIGRASLEVVLPNPLTLLTEAMPDGKLGQPYMTTLAAAEGTAPYSWSLLDGELPEGLTLDPLTGEISGVIAADAIRGSDTYTFTVQVEDAAVIKQTVSRQLSLHVAPKDLIFDTSDWIDGEIKPGLEEYNHFFVGDPLAVPLQASGGIAPYTWFISQGALPQGIVLDAETGIISGVSVEAGSYAFEVTIIDSAGSAQSAPLSIHIVPRPMTYVQSGTSDDPEGIAQAVSGDVAAVAYGQGTVTTAVFENNPAGDTTGVFQAANRYFDVKAEPGHAFNKLIFTVENVSPSAHTVYWWNVEDQAWRQVSNQSYQAATQSTTVTIDTYSSPNLQQMYGTEFGIGTPLMPAPVITKVALADASGLGGAELEVHGAHYTPDSFIMFDDIPLETVFVSETLLRGFLIPGSGTVAVRVVSPYGLSADSEASTFTHTGDVPTYRITLHAKLPGSGLSDPDIAIVQPGQSITIMGTVLNEHNQPVSGQTLLLAASQGTIASETVSDENGVFETALTIPETLYAAQVTLMASIEGDDTAVVHKIIPIHPAALQVMNETELPGALAGGEPYHLQLTASGGLLPYRWSITSGELPADWQLSEEGVLTGVPLIPGEYTFTVQVDGASGSGVAGKKVHKLIIHKKPPVESEITLPVGRVGTTYRQVMSASTEEGTYSWEVAEGVLPAGLTLTSAGILEGVPEESGSFQVKFIVRNELALEVELVTIELEIRPRTRVISEPEREDEVEQEPERTVRYIPAGESSLYAYRDELTLFIPAGSTKEDLWITIEQVANIAPLMGADDVLLSPVFELLKNLTEDFLVPITLTFRWEREKLGADEMPAVFYYDEQEQEWISLGGTIEGDHIAVSVDHFTKFAVFAVPQLSFTDIGGHWAETEVRQAASQGFIQGYPDGTFQPEKLVSRAEFAVMLARALKLEADSESSPLTFEDHADIPVWAAASIDQMVQMGIISGYEDHTFRPNALINRAEMAVMTARALELNVHAHTTTTFQDDQQIPVWAKGAIHAVSELAIVNGRGDGQFFPMEPAKRAEATVILLRMLGHIGSDN